MQPDHAIRHQAGSGAIRVGVAILAVAWVCCRVVVAQADSAAKRQPPVPLPRPDSFRTRETDHFFIWYDSSYNTLRPMVARLEGTYHAVVRVGHGLGFAMDAPAEPLAIVLVDRHEDFAVLARAAQVDPGGAAGFYDPNHQVAIFGNVINGPSLRPVAMRITQLQDRLSRLRGQGRAGHARAKAINRELVTLVARRAAIVKWFNRVVIQHEAAHHMLFNLGVHAANADNPLWLVEGLATQFETSQTNVRGELRHTNQMRLADLRAAAAVGPGVKKLTEFQYAHAFRDGGLIPLSSLVADFGADAGAGSGDRVTTAYAQSWALVFFLARERADDFREYVRRIAERPRGTRTTPEGELAAFSASFGAVDEPFQRAWLTYIVRLRFDPSAD